MQLSEHEHNKPLRERARSQYAPTTSKQTSLVAALQGPNGLGSVKLRETPKGKVEANEASASEVRHRQGMSN